MMQKIYFRADADSKIGFGHFVRTLALADMLKENFDCVFFTQSPTDYQKSEVAKVCKLVELPSNDSKFDLFLKYLSGDEIVFLDNYFFTPKYEKAIKDLGCRLVTISPNGRHHYADVLLNMGDDDISMFDVESYTKICRGFEWTILRPAFLNTKPSAVREKGRYVLCFGGTDQFGLTEKVTDALLNKIQNVDIHIVATALFSKERVLLLRDKGCHTHIDVSAEEITKLFDTCEAAILSTSTVAIEALSRGVRVYAGYYVDNQYKFCNYLTNNKYIIGLGDLLSEEMPERLISLIHGNQIWKNKIPTDLFATKEKYLELFKSI